MAPSGVPNPVEVALEFTRILESLEIRHLIGGSFASSVHGEPRSTNDVDFLADVRGKHVNPLLRALEADYYVSESAVREAIGLSGSFNAIHMDAAVKVDVFVAGDDAFDRERLERRERLPLPGEASATAYVDTAEHSVLRKLEWYRRGGEVSDRQWRDVVSILRIQGDTLDADRLDGWAERLGIGDLLERARRQAADDG